MARTENGGVSQGSTSAYTTITLDLPVASSTSARATSSPVTRTPGSSRRTRPTRRTSSTGSPVARWSGTTAAPAGPRSAPRPSATGSWSTTSVRARRPPPSASPAPTTYAGWCGNGCNPGGALPFTSGIDTNYGGSWHRRLGPGLPNRMPTSFAVDQANAAHVSRSTAASRAAGSPTAGVGHVFESTDGGATWTDVSGNLPDAPANDVVDRRAARSWSAPTSACSASRSAALRRPGAACRPAERLPSYDLAPSPKGRLPRRGHPRPRPVAVRHRLIRTARRPSTLLGRRPSAFPGRRPSGVPGDGRTGGAGRRVRSGGRGAAPAPAPQAPRCAAAASRCRCRG